MNNSIKNNALSGSLWKFLERTIAQGLSLIVSVVIARNLTPDEYSIVGIVIIFFSFTQLIIMAMIVECIYLNNLIRILSCYIIPLSRFTNHITAMIPQQTL